MSERLILSPQQERDRALRNAVFAEKVSMRFELFKMLLAEEYRLARGDMRRISKEKGAKKDEKVSVEIGIAIATAINASDMFMHQMNKQRAIEEAAEVKRMAEAAKAEAAAGEQTTQGTPPSPPAPPAETVSPGGIVLP